MVSDLIKYIEDAKKNGFAIDQIRDHLSRYGWNDYLVEYAVRQVNRREDRKWLQGSMMAVIAIFLATSATVWWVEADKTPHAIPCLLESADGNIAPLTQATDCCSRIVSTPCSRLAQGPQVRDTKGNTLFTGDFSCPVTDGRVLIQSAGFHGCRTGA